MDGIISSRHMKKIDSYATENLGIPSIILMENAGVGSYYLLKDEPYKSYVIVCSTGNNGGDGLVLARQLFVAGKFVYLNIVGDMDRQTDEFKTNLEIIKKIGLSYRLIKNKEVDLEILKAQIQRSDAVIDAILGIGLTRDVEGIFADTINTINEYSKYTVSLDIPSGLECDNGIVMGTCIKANRTITFYKTKNALVNESQYSGKVDVVPISIPYDLTI